MNRLMLTDDKFLADVERHLQRTGTRPATFGKKVLKDPNFVYDLRKGRAVSIRTAKRVYEFMGTARKTSQ